MAVSSHQSKVICYAEVVAKTFYLRNAGRKHKNKTKFIYGVLRWNPRKEGQDRDGEDLSLCVLYVWLFELSGCIFLQQMNRNMKKK